MRRTVKAWIGVMEGPAPYLGWHFTRTAAMNRHALTHPSVWTRCTITYDDGKPAPRKRKGGGK